VVRERWLARPAVGTASAHSPSAIALVDAGVGCRWRADAITARSTGALAVTRATSQTAAMTERFERHRQPWTPTEIQKLHLLASKGASLAAICKALTRSEESVKIRAKLDKLLITKKR
jgi:hypothetical protein